VDQVNAASALWKRSKSEIKDDEYKEFYKTISHGMDEPLHWIHTQAEGQIDYTTLFYIPQKAPMDLFRVDYQAGVKLYVKRVFITDDDKELMPTYLRFIRGVIDTEDLPLNVSREILQQNRVMAKIKTSSVKKILDELAKLQKNDREKYVEFYKEFGIPVKEGLYQDFENREKLMDLVMYKSTKVEGYTSLAEYIERKQADQESIYYITGKQEENLRNSPLLEMYKSKDIEVLIMDDEIDEIVSGALGKYKTWDLKSVNRSDAAEDLKTEADKDKEKEIEPVIKKIKKVLGEQVKDVKASTRLSDSPSCIVADSNDPTMQMQHILQQMGQGGMDTFKPILEVNPGHDIVNKLKDTSDKKVIEDVSYLLLEQAMLIEGAELKNPVEFVQRVNRIINKAI
jgi:molecular chaperone HtpG